MNKEQKEGLKTIAQITNQIDVCDIANDTLNTLEKREKNEDN